MDVQMLKSLIHSAHFCKNNQERQQAEDTLLTICIADERSIDMLANLSIADIEMGLIISQVIVTLLRKKNSYPHQLKMHYVDSLLNVLKSNCEARVKTNIQIALQQLIDRDISPLLQNYVKQACQQPELVESALYTTLALQSLTSTSNDWLQSVFCLTPSDLWCHVIVQICEFYLSSPKKTLQQLQDFIICNEVLCQNMMRAQQSLFQAYFRIYSALFSRPVKINSPFYLFMETQIPLLFYHLLEQQQANQTDRHFMVKILALCAKVNKLYDYYYQAQLPILLDVLYPGFVMELTEEPEDFIGLTVDCIEECKSDVYISNCALLLENYCDYVDGAVSFFIHMIILINQNKVNHIPNYQNKAISRMTPNQIMETSLFMLSIMNYHISKRPEIQIIIEDYINSIKNQDFRIQSRLSTLLSVFNYSNRLNILIDNCMAKNKFVSYAAIDSLRNIIEEKRIPQDQQANVLKALCDQLQQSSLADHFEAIKSMFTLYNPDYIQQEIALKTACQKIIYEQQLVDNGEKERQIYVNLAFNILKTIASQGKHLQTFECIEQLVQYLEQPEQVDFDEDICYMLNDLLQHGFMPQSYQKIFYCFPKILDKQNDRCSQLFELLNSYVCRQVPNYQLFVEMMGRVIKFENEVFSEVDQCEGVLLLQLLLQKHQLPQDVLQKIFNLINERSLQPIHNHFFKANLFGVILSGIEQFIPIYPNFPLQQELVNAANSYMIVGYPIKLYVFVVIQLIKQNTSFLTLDILNSLAKLLLKQYEKEMLDDDDDDDDLFKQNQEEEEYQMSLGQFKSDIKSIDEYALFHQLLPLLKSIELPSQIRTLVDKVLQIQRVETKTRRIIKVLKRR